MKEYKSRSRRLRAERKARSAAREAKTLTYQVAKPIKSEWLMIKAHPSYVPGFNNNFDPYILKQAERKERKAKKLIRKNSKTVLSVKYNPNTPKARLRGIPDYSLPKPAFKKPTRYQYVHDLGEELLTTAQYYELLKVGKVKPGSYHLTTKGYRQILGKKRIPHFD